MRRNVFCELKDSSRFNTTESLFIISFDTYYGLVVAAIVTYASQNLVAAEIPFLLIFLQTHHFYVLPEPHDDFLTCRLMHIDDIFELGAEGVAFGFLVSDQIDCDIEILVSVPLERQFVKVGSSR